MTPTMMGDLIDNMLKSIDEGTRQAYRMLWDIFMSSLEQHWLAVLIVLAIVFLIALTLAFMGRWGMLGSVLYNYLYFGILFIVGLIKGPEIFVSEYFEIACAIILYPVCYFAVGIILDKLGVRKF